MLTCAAYSLQNVMLQMEILDGRKEQGKEERACELSAFEVLHDALSHSTSFSRSLSGVENAEDCRHAQCNGHSQGRCGPQFRSNLKRRQNDEIFSAL